MRGRRPHEVPYEVIRSTARSTARRTARSMHDEAAWRSHRAAWRAGQEAAQSTARNTARGMNDEVARTARNADDEIPSIIFVAKKFTPCTFHGLPHAHAVRHRRAYFAPPLPPCSALLSACPSPLPFPLSPSSSPPPFALPFAPFTPLPNSHLCEASRIINTCR